MQIRLENAQKMHQNHWKLVHCLKINWFSHGRMPSVLAPQPKAELRAFGTGLWTFGASEMDMTTLLCIPNTSLPEFSRYSAMKTKNFDIYKCKYSWKTAQNQYATSQNSMCIFMTTSFKSICLLFQTSQLNLYFASSFSQFASLQLIMSSKQVDICWRTARNRHTSSREITATHNKQRHICMEAYRYPSV